ncbi:MAG: TAT-variant-translocated molybdopterin oxidoreductase, partial [Verrucomicrobiota bacterium]
MKRIIKHPEPKEGDLVGPRYWKSLDDLAETPEFKTWLEREFPAGAAEAEGVNRRHFMKIMAASFGLAGMGVAGCRRPEFHIRPYGRQPENLIPGVPNFYSSSMPGARENLPLVVETHQARPTKVEGNPSYEPTGGKTNQYAQASVLNLYDPDRMKRSESDGNRIAPKAVRDQLDAIGRAATANDGKGVAFLAEPSTSPSRQRLVNSLLERAPQAIWAEYEAIDRGVAERALGGLIGEGARVRPLYDFAEAKRILSVDCDFLGQEDGAVQYTRGFAKTRKVAGAEEASKMSRLYAVESDFTLTGAAADHRLRLSGVYMTAFISRLAAKVFEEAGMAADLVNLMRDHASGLPVDPAWIDACAADLFEHQGHALVTAGSHLPEEAQVLVAAINEVLGANGSTVSYLRLPDSPAKTLAELASALQSGEVETLIILGGNPAYDAPAGLNFVELLKSVPRVIRHSYNFDDTSELASENIAASHYLESWSDGRALDGTIVPVQPMIEPLFETVSELEFLARTTAASETDSYAIVRATLDPLLGGTGEQATNRFNTFLAEGTAADTAYPQAELPAMTQSARAAAEQIDVPSTALGLDNLECRFAPSAQVADGRYNNNGWLLEMPEPMTKLTWDNAILISPRLARQLEDKWQVQIIPGGGVINAELWGRFKINKNKAKFNRGKEMAPLAELTLGGKTIKAPIHVQPGLPNHTVVLPLGWGRARSGRVGEGVGFNFYPLRESGAAFAHGAQIKVLDEYYKLANTQEHWSMEGRAIVREATVDDFKKKPDFVDSMGMESHSPPIYGKSKDKSIEYKALNQPRGSSLYKTPDFGAPPPNVDAWKSEEAKEKFIPPQQW